MLEGETILTTPRLLLISSRREGEQDLIGHRNSRSRLELSQEDDELEDEEFEDDGWEEDSEDDEF